MKLGGKWNFGGAEEVRMNVKARQLSNSRRRRKEAAEATVQCSLCEQWVDRRHANNAAPFKGKCCDACNQRFVIPARLLQMQDGELFRKIQQSE